MTLEKKQISVTIDGTQGIASASITGELRKIILGDAGAGYNAWVNAVEASSSTSAILVSVAVAGTAAVYPSVELQDSAGGGRGVYKEHTLNGKIEVILTGGTDTQVHQVYFITEKKKG